VKRIGPEIVFSCASGARFIGELVEYMNVEQKVRPSEIRIRADAAHPTRVSEGMGPAKGLRWQERAKNALDFVGALALLLLTAPIILLAALAVKLTSRGPFIYSQTRTGKDGKPFTVFKIRTMTHNCENQTGAVWACPGDPRITLVGRWLRRTHIDELPQLWNILRGEMSLVGPRPERPEFVVQLEQVLPDYRRRLTLKPGLSGLAQMQLPPDTDLESVGRKLVYDLYYVDRGTLWLDIRIILCTVCKVLHFPLAVPRMLLKLPTLNHFEGANRVAADEKPVMARCETASVPSVS
jgi:lipopolysaccharide/colanic/teichoic acid biosynthesis glycosyltransferase